MSEGSGTEKSELFGKRHICLWTLPRDSKPIVRVEVKCGEILCGSLFEIGCDTIGLNITSRSFFALFRGITYPTKKYESDEIIRLPCKAAISIQKWCFDLTKEIKSIKTDAEAYRLLAFQFMFAVENGKIKLSAEDRERLEIHLDQDFPCYKQYVDIARTIEGYDSFTIQNVTVLKKVKLLKNVLQKGSKVNVVCNLKRLSLVSSSIQVSIPWRKIRRFAEIQETKSINLEIFLADDQAFAWIEVQCPQGTLLLQIIAEFIDKVRERLEKPKFRQPRWVNQPKANALTWAMIKQELFAVKKERVVPKLQTFDELEVSSSEDELNEEEEEVGTVNISRNKQKKKYISEPSISAEVSDEKKDHSDIDNAIDGTPDFSFLEIGEKDKIDDIFNL